jgi:16S rRNA processing protein RimM
MEKEACYAIGFVKRTSGLLGEVVIQLDVDDPQCYSRLDALFLDINGTLTPFFITKVRLVKELLTVAFEDITNDKTAKELVGTEVWLPLAALVELDDTAFYFHEIPGFGVVDTNKGDIGIATDVVDRYQQPVLRIGEGRHEILIPLASGIVQRIDRQERKLYITAPEGLIDIYLNPSSGENLDEMDNPFQYTGQE